MFDTLKSRIYQGNQFIKDIKNAPMREQFRGLPKLCKQNCSNCQKCLSVCPTGALSLEPFSIDMGKCTFCGACKNICKQGAIDFTNFYNQKYNDKDLVYCDPPYLITTGSYNDGNRGFKDWKEEEEIKLYNYLDKANEKNIKFYKKIKRKSKNGLYPKLFLVSSSH